jgi:hypothetical protein
MQRGTTRQQTARAWYKNLADRPNRPLVTSSDSTESAELLHVRTQSRAFVEARVRRLLLDTLYEHGQLSVLSDHTVELNWADLEPRRSGDLIPETISVSINTMCQPSGIACSHVSSKPHRDFAGLLACPPAPRNPFSPRGRMDLF